MGDKSREIDWESVEVENGDAAIALTGTASKAWADHFAAVLRLLTQSQSGWGEVRLAKKAIKVAAVEPGSEDDLRHLLESVVMQVNSKLRPDADTDQGAQARDPQEVADEQMTERFRSFTGSQD